MSILLLCEIKKHTTDFTLIEFTRQAHSIINTKSIKEVPNSKTDLIKEISEFTDSQKLTRPIDKKIVMGCFYSNKKLAEALQLNFVPSKFNNAMPDLQNGITFIEKHELLVLNNYNHSSSFFEFNQNKVLAGNRGMIVSVGKHLQCFEEHVDKQNRKEITRVKLEELTFSPQNDFDHQFSLFIRKESNRTLKYKEVITKSGLKLAYLFHVHISHGQIQKEPTFQELLDLVSHKDEVALKAIEFFIKILGHFLYSALVLIMPNKELILTGNFLKKILIAFNDDQRIRTVFMENLTLAVYLRHIFENLRISLQTNMNDLILKSVVENF